MNIRKSMLSGLLASSIALGGGAAIAQEATPGADQATPVTSITVEPKAIKTAEGDFVGYATLWENETGVTLVIKSSGDAVLEPGQHGVHLHEFGVCDSDAAFDSAGGHFNPSEEQHGDANADPSHAGDLGNLTVEQDGSFEHKVKLEKATLQPNANNSLNDVDGTAIIIHAGEDDLTTDPSGESGDRVACGVIFDAIPEALGTPEATPLEIGTPEATPGS
jgi:Cu-Zn family superoxide dismutase